VSFNFRLQNAQVMKPILLLSADAMLFTLEMIDAQPNA